MVLRVSVCERERKISTYIYAWVTSSYFSMEDQYVEESIKQQYSIWHDTIGVQQYRLCGGRGKSTASIAAEFSELTSGGPLKE